MVKAVVFPETTVAASAYDDSEDFSGSLPVIFQEAMAFIKRNLRKVQAGRGVNAPGTPEIPLTVFEELLVNALIHRDYLIEAPIRLFVFSDRIEIISPGHLPNHLTVEKIRAGNSNIRNPILASYVAKGMLPYHGIGSGIKRALADWPDIVFADDRDGCLFTAIVRRKPDEEQEFAGESAETSLNATRNASGKRRESVGKTAGKILEACRGKPSITIPELAERIGITERSVQRNIQVLQKGTLLRRVGGRKEGYWEVLK